MKYDEFRKDLNAQHLADIKHRKAAARAQRRNDRSLHRKAAARAQRRNDRSW